MTDLVAALREVLSARRQEADGLEIQINDLNTKYQYWLGRKDGIAECLSLLEEHMTQNGAPKPPWPRPRMRDRLVP